MLGRAGKALIAAKDCGIGAMRASNMKPIARLSAALPQRYGGTDGIADVCAEHEADSGADCCANGRTDGSTDGWTDGEAYWCAYRCPDSGAHADAHRRIMHRWPAHGRYRD